MRIAVMGAGSIGGYFGGMLARGGNQITLIARGDNLAAISQHGLKVIRDNEEFTVRCDVTDDPKQVGTVELALLTVKAYQNEQAIPALSPLVGPDTTILCLQNGIDTYQDAVAAFGVDRVLPGAAYIEAGRQGPGVVTQTGSGVRIAFGEQDGRNSDRGNEIADLLKRSGIAAQFEADIRKTLWTKFLFIATLAGVTTMTRESLDRLMPRQEWRAVIIGCMEEIERASRASGVNLDAEVVQDTLSYMVGSIDEMHASMHSDIVAGRPLELEALNGAVVRAGKDANVPTPINDVIYAMLKPYMLGNFDTPGTFDKS